MEIATEEGCCWKTVSVALQATVEGWLITNREMQLFLLGYIVISICEIFTIGGFPLNDSARLVWFCSCC